MTLADLAALSDVFYIGGTKCGALFGEAVVITRDACKPYFRATMKQHGGLLAKGRLLGIQFDVLFTDDLYTRICHDAIAHARRIRSAFAARGIAFYGTSTTNQQFPILPEAEAARFIRDYGFAAYWPAENGQQIVRYCTSWATTAAEVEALLAAI